MTCKTIIHVPKHLQRISFFSLGKHNSPQFDCNLCVQGKFRQIFTSNIHRDIYWECLFPIAIETAGRVFVILNDEELQTARLSEALCPRQLLIPILPLIFCVGGQMTLRLRVRYFFLSAWFSEFDGVWAPLDGTFSVTSPTITWRAFVTRLALTWRKWGNLYKGFSMTGCHGNCWMISDCNVVAFRKYFGQKSGMKICFSVLWL